MIDKLAAIEHTYQELSELLSNPDVIKDQERFRKYAKAHSDLSEKVNCFHQWQKVEKDLANTEEMLKDESDSEMRELAQNEILSLQQQKAELEKQIRLMLLPKDPNDEKNILLEIRAGTGGEEAALFAADLLRMYTRYAESKCWKATLLSSNDTGLNGIKEAIVSIEGDDVYSWLKFESGVHRVQRVPATEAGGRVHTSTVTVAVLPEAEEVDIQIDPKDLRIDTFCSSGPGGQGVNTTHSAVRILHQPSGLVVSCQDERSQIKNRAKAMRILRSRLLEMEQQKQDEEIAKTRRAQVGTGDRSEKIRTYNFPQNRVTDHRAGLSLHKLESVLDGELDELIEALTAWDHAERLQKSLS